MADNITAEDMRNRHLDERQLFKRLVVDSRRGVVLCMYTIAYWIVLEGLGYPNFVQKMLRIHNLVVNTIVDEAVLCIDWLQSVTPPEPVVNVSDMPLTEELMGKPINISMLYTIRETILTKVNKTVFESLAIGFEDIFQEVSGKSFAQLNVQPLAKNHWNNGGNAYLYFYRKQAAPAFVGPSVYNCSNIGMYSFFTPSTSMFVRGSSSALPVTLPNHTLLGQDEHLSEIKRAIFFTFTRENPVHPKELEDFLERSFGYGCIQRVTLQQVPATEQPLWASVVFYSEIPVHALMQGRETAPLTINEKKVWAGKEWLSSKNGGGSS